MRRSKEEKHALNSVNYFDRYLINKTKLIYFFSFFIFAGTSTAQIPINGFCKYNSLKVDSGFTNIFPIFLNDDSYTDLLISNPNLNQVKTYKGDFKKIFFDSVETKLNISFSKVQLFNVKDKNYFAFSSRKDRTIGYFETEPGGKIKIKNSVKLNSFPENLTVDDFDKDGIDELLISGSSFEGISLFKNEDLSEKKVETKRAFSSAVFSDLNNDGFSDIAAIDLLSNSIKFFFKNFSEEFELTREINFSEKISNLHSYDFNLDGYSDLAFVKGNFINVVLGDSVSSYESEILIKTKFTPDKFLIADFNADGLNDIAYMNKKAKTLAMVFASDKKSFYDEILLLNSEIEDISLYISKFIKGIAAINKNGKLFLVNNLRSLSNETAIKLGAKPTSLSYFDAEDDKIIDFAYIDQIRNQLALIKRNSAGVPSEFYQIDLSEKFNSISIEPISKSKIVFHCFGKGKKLIDIIIVDFSKKKYQKEKVYTGGSILDLKLKSGEKDERPDIYILLNSVDGLKLNVLSYKNFRYTTASSKALDKNVKSAKLAIKNSIDIFYWKFESKVLQYYYLKIDKNFEQIKKAEKYILPASEKYKIVGIAGDIFNNEKSASINFINAEELSYAIVSDEERNFKLNLNNFADNFKVSDEENLYFGEANFTGLKKVFFYNNFNDSVDKLEISDKKRTAINKIKSAKNVGSYFIKSLNFKKFHLVFIDKEENCIRIKEI